MDKHASLASLLALPKFVCTFAKMSIIMTTWSASTAVLSPSDPVSVDTNVYGG